MKKNLLIGVLGSLLGLTAASSQAQTAARDPEGRQGSRLELGRAAGTRKPISSGRGFTLDKSLGSSTSVATPVFRGKALPVSTPDNRSNAGTRSGVVPTTVSESGVAPAETRSDKDSDNWMYTSDKLSVSNAYPNPANDVAEVDYQMTGSVQEAKLILLNVLGSIVAEYDLDRSDRKIRMNTRDLSTGYYFYQLSVDGKKLATRKLLVRHQ